jgi:hypothetical protein
MTNILRFPFPAAFDAHEAAVEADCVPLDEGPLHDARRALSRALEAERSLSRMTYLYSARDALHAAGQRAWAERAEIAAMRIGGGGRDVAELLFEVDCAVSRERHGAVVDPRDPDPSRDGIFRNHNCHRCRDGQRPCVRGSPRQCEWPHARND